MKYLQMPIILLISGLVLNACSNSDSSPPNPPVVRDYDSKASVMVYNLISDVSQTSISQFPHIKLETDPSQANATVWFDSLGPLSASHTAITWVGENADSIVYKIYNTENDQLLLSEPLTTQPDRSYGLFVYGDINGTIEMKLVATQDSHVDNDMVGIQVFHAASAYPDNVDLYITTDESKPIVSNLSYGSVSEHLLVVENIGKDYIIGGMHLATPDFAQLHNNDISSILPLSMHGGETHFVVIYSTPAGSFYVANVLDYMYPL